jgi:D-serine deaminase-like pyridoxal phosphate-dependent protein
MHVDELPTPCAVVDLDVLKRNVRTMADRLKALGVTLRPHVKTHKCLEIAALQREAGARGFTVSTLGEAVDLAEAGFTDLTWAFPLILNRLPEVRRIAERATLRLLVDSPEAIDALESAVLPPGPPGGAAGVECHVWLEVDSGHHRSGVDPGSAVAVELARRLHDAERLVFDGILTHGGHSYRGKNREELLAAAREERRVMADFAKLLMSLGVEVRGVSVGSTPTMSVVEDLDGVTEARPGNYVFHDGMMCSMGACSTADVALTVLSSVVSSQPGAEHSVIDAGALSLSKDPGLDWVEPASFGRVYRDDGSGEIEPDFWVEALSQEHGIVNRSLPVGSRLRILPNHSCLVGPNFDAFQVVEGERVVDRWSIRGLGRSGGR